MTVIKRNRHLTVAEVNEAIRAEHGLLMPIAERLGVRRSTLRTFINRRTECLTELRSAREGILDLAEKKLFEQISDGEPWALAFVLRTLGKERGYAGDVSSSVDALNVTTINIVAVPAGQVMDADASVAFQQVEDSADDTKDAAEDGAEVVEEDEVDTDAPKQLHWWPPRPSPGAP